MLKKRSAFTLVEILIVITILGVLMTMVAQSYWGLVQSYRKAEIMRQLQRESNFALTRITDKMRYHSLNYEAYDGGACAGNPDMICLGDHVFLYEGGNVMMDEQPLFSEKGVVVRQARFEFTPTLDPFTHLGNSIHQTQPQLTLFLEVGSREVPTLSFDLQTTISSRKYTP